MRRRIRVRWSRALQATATLAVGSSSLSGQDVTRVVAASPGPTLVVRDVGPGVAGRLLRGVLAAPHATIARVDSGPTIALRPDTVYATSVVVLGRDVTVASTVHGDVVVVGGDLFLHPGATIDGRAVAIGGGVYNSTLATVRGDRLSFRDETFRPEGAPLALAAGGPLSAADTLFLAYTSLGGGPPPAITFPAYGFRLPAYDRVNGLSLAFGPLIALDSGRIDIEPTLTYRSDLGEVDPLVRARLGIGRRLELSGFAGRGTRTNEDWNRTDFLNAISSFFGGIDARNYYRADVAEARVSRAWEGASFDVTPFVGAATERAWSVGPEPGTESAPFSLFLRRDREKGMERANPAILPGRITSALMGADVSWSAQQVVAVLGARVEQPLSAPGELRFSQATLDGGVGFPTFGTQRLDIDAHAVLTVGGTAPPQRFAYLGGEDGTIVTRRLLEMGGDQLLYVNGLYSIPVERIRIRFLGSPTFAVRYAVGSAGIATLPSLVQNVGVRVSLSFLRYQFMIDPATRDTRGSIALSLFR